MEFHFKQFSVKHDKSAMKVGTDGNLLGAWCGSEGKKRALDIGTGTGLIALMMAQREPRLIVDAIDLDRDSFEEASFNVSRSPFADRINTKHISFEEFDPEHAYDLIVCNPPFFFDQYISKSESRTLARQGNIDWMDWIPKINDLLSDNGSFEVIFPIDQKEKFLEILEKNGLFISKFWAIFPKPHKPAHRCLFSIKKAACKSTFEKLIIETKVRHEYSFEYQKLMKSYLTIF
ncbi:MAG: methyltransferase [Flavobacteriales bacterium]|nr:methyltransferase [Flavobacteriales bacterium]